MKMLKKVTAVVAVLLLVFGTMSIGVTAAGETGSIGITITADDQNGSHKYYPGDIVTFTVNISTSFNYTAMRWPVMYTLKAFEPVIGNDGNGESDYGNVIGFGTLSDPDSYLESAEATTNEPFGGTYSKANYGCLLIQWTGGTSGNSVICYNEPNGADCLTFQLRVKPGYTSNGGVATVAVPTTNQAKSLFYLEGITTPTNGDSTFYLTLDTLTFTSSPETVSVVREQAGIQPKAGSDTVIEKDVPTHEGATINYIYGLNSIAVDNELLTHDALLQYVTLTGDATFEFIPLYPSEIPGEDPLISTGSKLRLYDANGKYLEEYTFVVFGDINGDGVFDMTDGSTLIEAYLGVESWSWWTVKDNPTFFACDVTGDGYVDSLDYGPLVDAILMKGYINQTNDPDNFFVYF